MENTQHTPGPWKASGEYIQYQTANPANDKPFWADLAHVSGPLVSWEQRQATANLIAAVPELLEALQLTYNQLFDIHAEIRLNCNLDNDDKPFEPNWKRRLQWIELALEQSQKALNKVKGRSNGV